MARETKTPEQLSIGDIVPVWGTDFEVANVEFPEVILIGRDPKPTGNAVVTFTNGVVTTYPPGVEIAIVVD